MENNDSRPTEKQISFIRILCEKLDYEPSLILMEAKTKQEASKLIDELKKECGLND